MKQQRVWLKVAALNEIPIRGARCFQHGNVDYAVFRTADDSVFSLKDQCPHKQGPLSQGIVHDGSVTCPLHNWVISLKSGEALGADVGSTETLPVKVEDGAVSVLLPQDAPIEMPAETPMENHGSGTAKSCAATMNPVFQITKISA